MTRTRASSASRRLFPPLDALWKRYVTGRPDRYQAYVSFPTASDRPSIGSLHRRIEGLERVFEGRLDVYARRSGLAVVTDPVPAEGFDAIGFQSVIDSIETAYAETHDLARLEKWRSIDDHLVKSYVIVPVRPLFPRDSDDRRRSSPTVD